MKTPPKPVPFKKVLIANRGEIASRVIRTCKRLGIKTVAVHSDADAKALFVEEADEAVALGGDHVKDSYLALDKLERAIVDSGADAVHPGYGMLSEDSRLCQTVSALGVAFIGPRPEALSQLGDKIVARSLASAVGLMPPPGTEQAIDGTDMDGVLRTAASIGFPIMIKAAAGGGGIGMQRVEDASQLATALATSQARSQAAFGDGRVYLERALIKARHVEVQVARDAFGTAVAIGDRECSVQRRHQKILEECPAPVASLDAASRRRLYDGACSLFDRVGYVGVGTVEFLIDDAGEVPEVFFLEVNARIQVEHPVTELVYGVDLVEIQLDLAASRPLDSSLLALTARGHAVEVRIYAEDPARAFVPQPGRLERLVWPQAAQHLRIEASYRQGDVVTTFYDPLLAKLICHGENRAEALERLARALSETTISLQGPKGARATNKEFLQALLEEPALQSGQYDTELVQHLKR